MEAFNCVFHATDKYGMNENFCILPWIHLHSYPDNTVAACCDWDRSHVLGNVKTQKLTDVANSAAVNQIRSDMLNNKPVAGCQLHCQRREKSGVFSSRTIFNEAFADDIANYVDQTNPDGSINYDFQLRFMNVRYSNLCNFACRTCGPSLSSLWAQQRNVDIPVKKITDTNPTYLTEVFEHLPHVKRLHFAGGESSLIDEHWAVLDRLLEVGNTDLQILWVTNLSKLSYKHKNLIDYIKKFKNFLLVASIDASHERAEMYRYGTVWKTVESNLQTLRDNNITFSVNCTIGAMNVWHATDLQKHLLESGLIEPGKFRLNNLIESPWLSTKVLPDDFKSTVKDKILKHISWLQTNNIPAGNWQQVIDFMLFEDHSHLLPEFRRQMLEMDQLRNESSATVFPELSTILA